MARIEDALWTHLVGEPEAGRALAVRQPPPRRRSAQRAPLAVASLLLLAALATAALTLTAGTSTTPAYAVTVNANGSITVTLNEVIGVGAANEALARLGVRARIAEIEPGCTQTGEKALPPGTYSHEQQELMVEPRKVGEGLAGLDWVIHPNAIPAGDTLLITAELANGGRPVAAHDGKAVFAVGSSIGLYRGAAPTCQPPGTFYPG
jgi:hypothetical protein